MTIKAARGGMANGPRPSPHGDAVRFAGRSMFYVGSAIGLLLLSIYAVFASGRQPEAEDLLGLVALNAYSYYLLTVIFGEYKRGELASPLGLFASAMFLYFGFAGILYFDSSFFVNGANRQGYLAGIAYIAAFTFAFQISQTFFRFTLPPRNAYKPAGDVWQESRVILVVVALLLVAVAARLTIINSGMYLWSGMTNAEALGIRLKNIGLLAFLSSLGDLAGWLTWTFYLRLTAGGLRPPLRVQIITFALLAGNLMYWLPTGSKLNIATSLLVPFFIYYLTFRRLPRARYMLVGLLAMALMFPATHVLRVAQRNLMGSGSAQGVSEIVQVMVRSAEYSGNVRERGANGRTFGRLNQHEVVAGTIRVIDDGDEPLRGGVDYANALVNLIPRFLWPDKPYVMYGNEFGHMIGMLMRTDIGTSIAPTYIGESYLNFGPFGLIAAPLLCLVFYIPYRLISRWLPSQTMVLLYATGIPTLLYIDGSFGLYISSLIRIWLFILAVGIFVSIRLGGLSSPRTRGG